MGWGAAYALAEEWGIEPEDAHDMLYGGDPKPWRCPICGKKCKSRRGVLDHADATHKKADHIRRVAVWWAEGGSAELMREARMAAPTSSSAPLKIEDVARHMDSFANTQDDYSAADALCLAMMAMRPDLEVMSLDEWVLSHRNQLTDAEIGAANAILALHPDRATR